MNGSVEPGDASRPCLLFVDRSRLMRLSAERILGHEFRVVLAENAELGWIKLMDDPLIQVVFHDLVGPDHEIDFSLLERVRQSENRRVRDTPVVVLTDDDDSEEHRAEALSKGATDFIDKPFRPSELVARARALATTSEAAQRLRLMQRRHNRDAETELGNRRYFFERLAQALSFAKRQRQPLSLVHVHLAGLAQAFEPGQRVQRLAQLGRILGRAVRQEDTVYRTGPETFSFILPGTPADGAEAVRCRLAPELDGLGLMGHTAGHHPIARFIVQTPELGDEESMVECLRRIREGMGPVLVSPADPAPRGARPPASADDLETLLEMARHGDADQLKAHLPEILDRLKPLLDLASQADNEPPTNTD